MEKILLNSKSELSKALDFFGNESDHYDVYNEKGQIVGFAVPV